MTYILIALLCPFPSTLNGEEVEENKHLAVVAIASWNVRCAAQ